MDESMASRKTLPTEIIRDILRFFTNDRQALLNCALVSQEWLFESRCFLFRKIDIQDHDSSDLFVSKVLHSERLRPWLTSIRHLSLAFIRPLEDHEESFLFDISEHLSNLRTMKWHGFRHNGSPLRSELFLAFGKFSFLHHLKLSLCTFASFQDLKKVLVAMPTLTSITLVNVAWDRPPDTTSSELPSAPIWPTALSKLSVSGPYFGRQCADDVMVWLSTAPTRHLAELSFHLYHVDAALQLLADASLTTLDVKMADTDKLLADTAQVTRLGQLFSQVRDIEFLRLDVSLDTWAGIAGLLRLFGCVSSVRRLRLCCFPGCCLPEASEKAEFSAEARQLDPILASSEDDDNASAFRTLRAVEFAWFFDDGDETLLREQQPLLSAWVQRTLPRLHARGMVEVCAYNGESVCRPTGLAKHAREADFPHARGFRGSPVFTVDFAWHLKAITDQDETLQEECIPFSCWMKCTLPRLLERYTVGLYCDDSDSDEFVFGSAAGLSRHVVYGPDFPRAVDWDSV